MFVLLKKPILEHGQRSPMSAFDSFLNGLLRCKQQLYQKLFDQRDLRGLMRRKIARSKTDYQEKICFLFLICKPSLIKFQYNLSFSNETFPPLRWIAEIFAGGERIKNKDIWCLKLLLTKVEQSFRKTSFNHKSSYAECYKDKIQTKNFSEGDRYSD